MVFKKKPEPKKEVVVTTEAPPLETSIGAALKAKGVEPCKVCGTIGESGTFCKVDGWKVGAPA